MPIFALAPWVSFVDLKCPINVEEHRPVGRVTEVNALSGGLAR